MRTTLLAFFLLLSTLVLGQGDTTMTIRVSSRQPFPQIGLDTKGRKYFVMSTRQDKAALIALERGLYADSLVQRFEEYKSTCDDEIKRLNQRVEDMGDMIDLQNASYRLLEENYRGKSAEVDNLRVANDALKAQVIPKRIPMWLGYVAGVVGTILILDVAKN